MTFDVLYEPWIPVTKLDGAADKLGILPLLKNAHALTAISSPSPLVEYGIYRLLCAFLMDVLRPETTEDLEGLLAEGRFSEERLEAYREECVKEGVSFDLFDEKRPFMQAAFDPRWDGENTIRPAAQLDRGMPHGNNHLLFEHSVEKYRYSPDIAMQYLCTANYFCPCGTEGPTYVDGQPPIYELPFGDNLFQTLVYSIIPQDAVKIPYSEPPVYWKSQIIVEPNKEVATTSLLFGLTFPTRRICLLHDANGFVNKVYYTKGLKFCGGEAWTDPHVAYRYSDKGRNSLKPDYKKEAWRNTGMLLGGKNKQGIFQAPLVLKQLSRFELSQVIRIGLFCACIEESAKFVATQRAELKYPLPLLENEYGRQIINDSLQDADSIANCLNHALNKLFENDKKKHKKHKHWEEYIAKAVLVFYAECQNLFWSQLCPQAAEADINDEASQKIRPDWTAAVCSIAKKEFERCTDGIDMGGRYLIARSEAEKTLVFGLQKMQKGDK